MNNNSVFSTMVRSGRFGDTVQEFRKAIGRSDCSDQLRQESLNETPRLNIVRGVYFLQGDPWEIF